MFSRKADCRIFPKSPVLFGNEILRKCRTISDSQKVCQSADTCTVHVGALSWNPWNEECQGGIPQFLVNIVVMLIDMYAKRWLTVLLMVCSQELL